MTEPPSRGLAVAVMVYWFKVNVAVTVEFEVMVNVQSPVPEQLDAEPVPSDQPAKVEEPASGAPCRVIFVPYALLHLPVLSAQVNVHPDAVTVPLPLPVFDMVRAYCVDS